MEHLQPIWNLLESFKLPFSNTSYYIEFLPKITKTEHDTCLVGGYKGLKMIKVLKIKVSGNV